MSLLLMLFLRQPRQITGAAYIALAAYGINIPAIELQENASTEVLNFVFKTLQALEVILCFFLGSYILYHKNSHKVDSVMSIHRKASVCAFLFVALTLPHVAVFVFFTINFCHDFSVKQTMAV